MARARFDELPWELMLPAGQRPYSLAVWQDHFLDPQNGAARTIQPSLRVSLFLQLIVLLAVQNHSLIQAVSLHIGYTETVYLEGVPMADVAIKLDVALVLARLRRSQLPLPLARCR